MAQDDLTTLARVKKELDIDIGDVASDDYLNTIISEASAACETYLNRKLAKADVVQRWLYPPARFVGFLARYPLNTLTHVKFVQELTADVFTDYATVDIEKYWIDNSTGVIEIAATWNHYALPEERTYLEVSYNGGYDLPDVGSPTDPLPLDIESAVVLYCKNKYYTRNRDPLLKAEMIPDVLALQYYNPQQQSEYYATGIWEQSGMNAYRNTPIGGLTADSDRFRNATTVEIY